MDQYCYYYISRAAINIAKDKAHYEGNHALDGDHMYDAEEGRLDDVCADKWKRAPRIAKCQSPEGKFLGDRAHKKIYHGKD